MHTFTRYTKEQADGKGIVYRHDWRESQKGDWVLTYDNYVIRCVGRYKPSVRRSIEKIYFGLFALYTDRKIDFILDDLVYWDKTARRYLHKNRWGVTPKHKATIDSFLLCGNWEMAIKSILGDVSKTTVGRVKSKILNNVFAMEYLVEKLSERWKKYGLTEKFVCQTTKRIMELDTKEAWNATEKMINVFALDKQVVDNDRFGGDIDKLPEATYQEMIAENSKGSGKNGENKKKQ